MRNDWSSRCLIKPADTLVTVDRHHQAIALGSSLLETRQVTGVQQVKAAVGQHHSLASFTSSRQHFGQRLAITDLLPGRTWPSQQIRNHLAACHRDHADLFDFQSPGCVGQPGHRLGITTGRSRQADRGQNHVSRAGDVVDLPSASRHMARLVSGCRQGNPVAVQCDKGDVQIQHFTQFRGGGQTILDRPDHAPRRTGCLGAIGSDCRRTPVEPVIGGRGRIDNHRNPRFAAGRDHSGQQPGRADTLGVVGDQDRIDRPLVSGNHPLQRLDQFLGNRPVQWLTRFAVDPQDLVRVPMLSPSDHPGLDSGRTRFVGHDQVAADARARQLVPHLATILVVSDDTGHHHLGLQASQHVRNVGRPAQPALTTILP